MADSNGSTCMVQGRIVWCSGKDVFSGKQKVDQTTKVPRLGKNNEPLIEYGFGLAVPKSALVQGGAGWDLWMAMHNEAYTLYPSRQIPPAFAMKYKDGDGIDDKGQPFANRKGYQAHYVFAMTTTIPIKFFRYENGQNIMVNEGIKCGDYVQVQVQVKAHPAQGQGKPGLYLNPNAVLFLGYGEEIINAPSGDQIFGTQAPALPQGASATPIAPTGWAPPSGVPMGAPAPGMPTFANPGYPPQGAPPAFNPSMQQAPSLAPPPTAQPHYGVLPAAHQPQMQPQMQQAPQGYAPPPQPQYQQPVQQMAPPQQYAQPQAAPQGFPAPGAPQMPGMPPFPGQR